MKGLCEGANVDPRKVFPHNLRHLFARIFYGLEKDIARLADILGNSSVNTTRIYIVSTGCEHPSPLHGTDASGDIKKPPDGGNDTADT